MNGYSKGNHAAGKSVEFSFKAPSKISPPTIRDECSSGTVDTICANRSRCSYVLCMCILIYIYTLYIRIIRSYILYSIQTMWHLCSQSIIITKKIPHILTFSIVFPFHPVPAAETPNGRPRRRPYDTRPAGPPGRGITWVHSCHDIGMVVQALSK